MRPEIRSAAVCALVLTGVLSGCATPPRKPTHRLVEPARPSTVPSTADDEPIGVLDLRGAAALALRRNPELAAGAAEIRAREGAVAQAGAHPNPAIILENVGGIVESTAQLGHLFELGGKRSARVRLAGLNRELSRWDYQVRQNDVLRQVAGAYVELLTAQERLTVTADLVRLAEQVAATVSERVKAGKVAPIEETRAGATVASTRLELARVEREIEAARRRLAATWGSPSPRFDAVAGRLPEDVPVPVLEELARGLSRNPELARWETEVEQRRATLGLEQARAVPDVTIGAGPRWLNESRELAFVVGVSVPLPLFNRNEGAIEEARRRLEKADHERAAVRVRLMAALGDLHRELAVAAAEVDTLRREILPAAQTAFDAINEGYRFGKFGLLDVLDAQRALFEARGRFARAVGDYHKAVAEAARLVNAPLGEPGSLE